MTANHFRKAMTLLFGATFKHAAEDAFDLNRRSLLRMLNGDIPVPAGLALEVEDALRARANEIDELRERIAA